MWIINGQKVWTSGGQIADMGMLHRAHQPDRAEAPGHHVVRLRHAPEGGRGSSAQGDDGPRDVQRGVHDRRDRRRRRPHRRRERRLVRRQHDAALRAIRHGRRRRPRRWARSPGTIAGNLDKRAGDFVRQPSDASRRPPKDKPTGVDAVARRGLHQPRPRVRQGQGPEHAAASRASPHSADELARLNTERHKAVRATRRRHPRAGQLLEAADGRHPSPQPRHERRHHGRPRHVARLHRRAAQDAGRRAGRHDRGRR